MGIKRGQMKIQQMAFMILAVFFLFILVGLFFLAFELKDVHRDAAQLEKEQAITSLGVIADMPELNCDSRERLCLDKDKLKIMSGNFGKNYDSFWPVASVRVYQIYPAFDEQIECPAVRCNYYEIFKSDQKDVREYSTYVSICEKVDEGYRYDKCDIGKLLVGMRIYE